VLPVPGACSLPSGRMIPRDPAGTPSAPISWAAAASRPAAAGEGDRNHVVWDWNGTLFDDHHLVVDALNHVLDDVGLPPTDAATYQRLYTRPVHVFYERVFGRPIDDAEWVRVDELFHTGYKLALEHARLAVDAHQVLDRVEAGGHTQSLLSMYRHEELVPLVDRFGIAERFTLIDGLRGPGGGQKAPEMEAHLAGLVHLEGADPDRIVVIGDALDDAAAASHVGARCVLYDGGSHPRAELEATGVPVASTLTEALQVAGFR
jgi:phosphoglycolate phosphatase-like HAD superfamily hydrolase